MFLDITDWKIGGSLPSTFNVKDRHPEYKKMNPHWKKCRDARNGSKAIKEAGDTYLPRLESQQHDNSKSDKQPEEKEKSYSNYKERAIWYGATGQTVESFIGMMFAKTPTITTSSKDLDKELAESDMLKYASQEDESFIAFMKACADEVLTVNRVGILEDYPVQLNSQNQPIQRTILEAEKAKISSYSIMYLAEQIVNWGTEYIKGRKKESFYVLEEKWLDYSYSTTSPIQRERWRILLLDAYETREVDGEIVKVVLDNPVYRQVTVVEEKSGISIKDIQTPVINDKPFNYIPFWCLNVYGNMTDKVKEPEILDLVEMNIGHYRNSADREYELHYVAMKTPIFPGYNEDVVKEYGSPVLGNAVGVPMDSKPFILEAQSISGLDGEMVKKEERMSILGAQMLAQKGRYVQAAKTAEIQGQGESGILGSLAGSIEQFFSDILTLKLEWAGKKDIKGIVSLNKEYMKNAITSDRLPDLIKAVQSGEMSFDVFYYNLDKLGMYPDGWTKEKEIGLIEQGSLGAASQEILTIMDSIGKRVTAIESKGLPAGVVPGKPDKGAAA